MGAAGGEVAKWESSVLRNSGVIWVCKSMVCKDYTMVLYKDYTMVLYKDYTMVYGYVVFLYAEDYTIH